MSLSRHLVLFASTVFTAATLGAADGAMDVNAAIALAMANNERAAIARERLTQADGARREAWADVLPRLAATANYTVANPAGRSNHGALGLSMAVLDPGSYPRLRSALALYEANQLDASELRRALAFEVADAFAGALAAEGLVDAAVKRLAVNDEALRLAKVNVDAGLVARSDLTRTEVEQAVATGALVQVRAVATRTRLALGYLIGTPLERPLQAPTVLPETTPVAKELESEAQERRRDLQSLVFRTDAARHSAREPLMDTLPRLDLIGTASDGTALGGADDPRYISGDHPSWSLGLAATWQLYDGGARYGRRERLLASAREAELNEQAARRRLGIDIDLALADLATARAALATAETRVRAAQRNLDETHARFVNGLATAIEEADATASTFEASAELTRSRFSLWQAWLAINRTVGRWPTGAEPPAAAKE